jgi:hypothetical protein
MTQRVFGITGWKNSGKTTLTERLVAELTRRGHSVATVKHAHHAFDIDREGTDSWRHRAALLEYRAAHIQHMQKARHQMNVQLTQVLTDITGATGLAIIRAIVAGERDPVLLARFRAPRCASSTEDIAKALTGRAAERDRVIVGTKGGVTRPRGRWETDGSPRHLKAACERSLRALNVERIDLYQLHAPDPAVPFADSIGALAELKQEGKIRYIGVSTSSDEANSSP